MALVGKNDMEKLSDLGKRPYQEQGVWFLNAYYEKLDGPKIGEDIWKWSNKFAELDKRGKEGNELDEFQAHRFLESLGMTLSVKDMRDALREIDLDFNKKVAFIEFLVYKFKKDVDVHYLVTAPQGNKVEVEKATALLEDAQQALELAKDKAESSRKAEVDAKKAEADAKAAESAATVAEADAKAAEAVSKAAEEEARAAESLARAAEEVARKAAAEATAADNENKRALAELQKEEQAYLGKIDELTKLSSDSTSVVKKNKAAAELAQLKAEDPLPLRRAKINQGATVRKSEAAAKIATDSRIKAEGALKVAVDARTQAEAKLAAAVQARKDAEQSLKAAVKSRQDAEASSKAASDARARAESSLKAAEEAFDAAERYLNEVRSKVGNAAGSLWWIDRDLQEARKYLPQRAGGVAKK